MITDQAGDKDLSKHRIIELDNGNRVHLERRDPYGFIHVWMDKGAFPDKSPLHGVFTTWNLAYLAVEGYISDRNRVVSDIRGISVVSVKETNEDVAAPKFEPARPKLETKFDPAELDNDPPPILEKTTEGIKLKAR